MGRRSPAGVNSAVLLQALERYEQGRLPRSMQLWIQQLLELPPPEHRSADPLPPLRRHCG